MCGPHICSFLFYVVSEIGGVSNVPPLIVPMSDTTNCLTLSEISCIPKLDLVFFGVASPFCCNILISSSVIAFLLLDLFLSFLGVSTISPSIILLSC